jgi:hypothetical protein
MVRCWWRTDANGCHKGWTMRHTVGLAFILQHGFGDDSLLAELLVARGIGFEHPTDNKAFVPLLPVAVGTSPHHCRQHKSRMLASFPGTGN